MVPNAFQWNRLNVDIDGPSRLELPLAPVGSCSEFLQLPCSTIQLGLSSIESSKRLVNVGVEIKMVDYGTSKGVTQDSGCNMSC